MDDTARLRCARRLAAPLVALVLACTSIYAQATAPYKGELLADALRTLQAQGLRIVFTSATVTPALRVTVEPRATTPRGQLDELLAPHGLAAREGAGGVIQVVRAVPTAPSANDAGTIEGLVVDVNTSAPLAGVVVRIDGVKGDTRTDGGGRFVFRRVRAGTQTVVAWMTGYAAASRSIRVAGGTIGTVAFSLVPSGSTHREYVEVSGPWPYRTDQGVASEARVDRSQWQQVYGSLADDPIRVVHALPRVTPIDEFRSEFAVRGSPFRHAEVVVDGVSARWLQHTAHRRGATGSLAMLAAPALEDATLRAGAYPQRHGNQLGPQLELTLREGSRSGFALRGAVGGSHAVLLGEGPLGGSGRGSWLVAVRQSYFEWPAEDAESTRTAFGFGDGLGKVVYDVSSTQQASFTVLGGTSNIDGEDNETGNRLGDGTNRAVTASVSWRSLFGSAVLTQRAYVTRQHFLNKHRAGDDSDSGANEESGYRADVTRPLARGVLEAGAHAARTAIEDVLRAGSEPAPALAGSSWLGSGYAHFAWAATPALIVSPGVRVTTSTLVPSPTISRWLLGEWAVRPRWSVSGSVGVSQQLPELRHVLAVAPPATLRAERATQMDAGVEQRLTHSVRWQVTVFTRSERDILREPGVALRVGDIFAPSAPGPYVNALHGTSRGIELLVDRRSPSGLSGWAAYSYGTTRYVDAERAESFPGDFDRRHGLQLSGVYRWSGDASVGAAFRAGSGFPLPGYFTARGGSLFVGGRRNDVRLPDYARLDIRADRSFRYLGRRLTLFGEVLNVLNHGNAGIATGTVNPATGEVTGFTDVFRRRATAGLAIQF